MSPPHGADEKMEFWRRLLTYPGMTWRAPALFLLSITARKGTYSGDRERRQLEKVNGFQQYA